ncbi:MAG: nitroreductase family protein [Halobacteria archaeon]|nr:nitroreductase family protein [Halobacteria archaeon]
METFENIKTRRSVHDYDDGEVTDEELRKIFDAVRWAPSSYNLQPWEFLVVRDDEGQERLKECAYGQEHVTEASAAIVVFGNLDRGAHAEEVFSDMAEKGYRDEESAEEMIERMEEEDPEGNEEWAMQSTIMAAMTLMYAAWEIGLATCPMGGWDGDMINEEFDVPENYYPVLMLTLGHPDEDGDELSRERKWRRDAEDMVHLEDFEDGSGFDT